MPVDQDQPQRPPGRGNGLPAEAYSAIADLDPRVADDVLITLHANGIAAYIEPTPTTGSFLELNLPARLTDRLFADTAAIDRARDLVQLEIAENEPAAGQGELLPDDRPAWSRPAVADPDEDHFQPPQPPPLPRLRPSTVASLGAIALGLVILLTGYDGGDFGVLGVIAIVASAASFGT